MIKVLINSLIMVVVLAGTALGINYLRDGIPLIGNWELTGTSEQTVESFTEDGIHLIGLERAVQFMESGIGSVFDARSPLLYEDGHLPGAVNVYAYELDSYLPDLMQEYPLDTPIMVYCNGNDCEDSRFLAQWMQELGYAKLFIFEGGYEQWVDSGNKLESNKGDDGKVNKPVNLKQYLNFSRLIPTGFWMFFDLALFVFGAFILFEMIKGENPRRFFLLARFVVGGAFFLASLHKIASPLEFAKIIDNYHILPGAMINLTAIIMPWLELAAGFLLLIGRRSNESSVIIGTLLSVFIVAISFNLIRGVDFDCGCFGDGKSSPSRTLIRDIGLILCLLPSLKGILNSDKKAEYVLRS